MYGKSSYYKHSVYHGKIIFYYIWCIFIVKKISINVNMLLNKCSNPFFFFLSYTLLKTPCYVSGNGSVSCF